MSYLQIQKNRQSQGKQFAYVHLATSAWDASKGRSVQKRVYLGRLEPCGERLVVSKGYSGRSEIVVHLTEVRQRLEAGEDLDIWLRMLATTTASAVSTSVQDTPSRVNIVGDVYLLLKIAEKLNLPSLLEGAFGRDESQAILGLALHQAAEGHPIYLAADWLGEREIPQGMRGELFQTDRVYEIVARVGINLSAQEQFFRRWLEILGHPQNLICDITSISTYSNTLEQAEFGYNRDNENMPQVNLALVCDNNGMPVWYRSIPGSIPDVSSLKLTTELLDDLGIKKSRYSLDRGFYSMANIREMIVAGIGFTMGVPFSVKQAQQLIRKHRSALASIKRSFAFNEHVMRHVQDRWKISNRNGKISEVDAHIFLEPSRQADAQVQLEKNVFSIEAKALKETFNSPREARAWLSENARGMAACFAVHSANDRVVIQRKPRAIALMVSRFGYTVVITSETKQDREKVLFDYRRRDLAEKLYDTFKNEDGQRRLRTGSDNSVAGRLFVAFIALVLHSALEKEMRGAEILQKLSVAQFIAQMRKIKSVRMASGKRHLLEITKRNRDFIAALGIPLPD